MKKEHLNNPKHAEINQTGIGSSSKNSSLFVKAIEEDRFAVWVSEHKLQRLELLLAKVHQLESPQREQAFVAGCLAIGSDQEGEQLEMLFTSAS